MDQNDNKNKRGGKSGGSWRGVVQLVCWALLLTIVISYASTYMTSAGRQSSSVELEYKKDFWRCWSGAISPPWTSITARPF